jgi:hypothetical protein
VPTVTPALALIIFAAGSVAGAMGAALGIAGGVFLVPFLNLALGFPITVAAAVSLATVIATSSVVSAGRAGTGVINFRLGMVLEVATAAGSVLGGITAQLFAQSTLQLLFGGMTAFIAAVTARRINRRNVLTDLSIDPGRLGGRFYDDESGRIVAYRVRRLPFALVASFVAGNISSLLGVGGGVIKVPVLNAWCGVPLRVAAATSAFMIGVTATGGAVIYYGRGQLLAAAAGAAVLGVQLGSWAGIRLSASVPVQRLKITLAVVLAIVAVLMVERGLR